MYDEAVLLQQADSLQRQAEKIVARTAIIWGAAALVISFACLAAIQILANIHGPITVGAFLVGWIAVLAGIAEGKRRSFMFRLEAQKIYVLIEIVHRTSPDHAQVIADQQYSHSF